VKNYELLRLLLIIVFPYNFSFSFLILRCEYLVPRHMVASLVKIISTPWDQCLEKKSLFNGSVLNSVNNEVSFDDQESAWVETKRQNDLDTMSRLTLIRKLKTSQKHEKVLLKHINHLNKIYRKKLSRELQNHIKSLE